MRIINSCLPKMLCCSSTLFFNYETLRQPQLRLHTGLSLSQRVGLWRGCKETWLSVSLCNLCSPPLVQGGRADDEDGLSRHSGSRQAGSHLPRTGHPPQPAKPNDGKRWAHTQEAGFYSWLKVLVYGSGCNFGSADDLWKSLWLIDNFDGLLIKLNQLRIDFEFWLVVFNYFSHYLYR